MIDHPNGAKAIEFCPDRYLKFTLAPLITDGTRPLIFERNEIFENLVAKYVIGEIIKMKPVGEKKKSGKKKKART